MAHPVSPLAPKSNPELPEIAGGRFATAEAGSKYKGRTDVLLAAFEPGTTVAGVFTSSKCPSAPVDWCRANLTAGTARGLLVSSDAANAIMTTDTYAKVATATVEFDGVPVSISGIAKGSGMIAPAMATMLSFIFTDAPVAAHVLQGLLQPLINRSIYAVPVDSD